MRISIFGLGYVGAVCAGCLSARGHEVIGVDVSSTKIDLINQGKSPIVEPGLEALLQQGRQTGRLSGTTDFKKAVLDSDVSFICVGTPSKKNGDLDLGYIETVCREIGFAIREKSERHTVVVRSTVLPGTVNNVVIPLIEDCSGKKAGVDFGVGTNPEFLRESTAIKDYDFPPMTVIGELDKQTGDLLEEIYRELDAPIIRKTVEVAEMIKYTCNVWHAAKVTFANEIGNIAKAVGVDGREVMDVICQDHKLNLSRYYMRPGFAFGGSCLPKDVRALTYRASQLDVEHPMLGSLMRSNSTRCRRPSISSPATTPARSACSACRSRPAPTICAKARWWSWPRCSSARATSCASSTATSNTRVSTGPTRNTSSRRSRTSPHCWSPTSTKWWRVPMCWCWAMATSCSSTW